MKILKRANKIVVAINKIIISMKIFQLRYKINYKDCFINNIQKIYAFVVHKNR